jgi:hypothetical protein
MTSGLRKEVLGDLPSFDVGAHPERKEAGVWDSRRERVLCLRPEKEPFRSVLISAKTPAKQHFLVGEGHDILHYSERPTANGKVYLRREIRKVSRIELSGREVLYLASRVQVMPNAALASEHQFPGVTAPARQS